MCEHTPVPGDHQGCWQLQPFIPQRPRAHPQGGSTGSEEKCAPPASALPLALPQAPTLHPTGQIIYSLQAPAAHQDHSQLLGRQPLAEITFQLSSAAPGPLSRPGQGRHVNWTAKLSEGLVGAALGSPSSSYRHPCLHLLTAGVPAWEGGLQASVGNSAPDYRLGLSPASEGAHFSWAISGRSLKL